jgi:uncharacterized protein (TIGR02145 family)
MKTTIPFVLSLLFVTSFPCFGVNYSITFTGSGASNSLDSVIVQNLTRGTSVTILGGNTLDLSVVATAVAQLSTNDETIRVYPNLIEGKFTLSFYTKRAGATQINAFNVEGRKITGISTNLLAGVNSFQLSLPKGSFAIQVVGNGYTYTAKIINQGATSKKPEIVFAAYQKPVFPGSQKSKNAVTTMLYSEGDQLLYKAVSGNYSTILTDKPVGSKNTNFNFVDCTDADGNFYTVVTIGTQTWMAENLKTTLYNDGTSIPNVTDNTAWNSLATPAYCWYGNDASTYKSKYGALYNWFAVNTGKLAPVGWHVPTDAEWTTMENYLITNGYNYDGTTTGNKVGKALAATTDWSNNFSEGAVGNDLSKNNSSGFSALPGGGRYYTNGMFSYFGETGYWWTATEFNASFASYRYTIIYFDSMSRQNYYKTVGFSVRCIKD